MMSLKLYYDKDGFHSEQDENNMRYETTMEYRQQLADEMNNHPSTEDDLRIVPDRNGKPILRQIEIDYKPYYRKRREYECFSVINRGQAWYRTLSKEQLEELDVWYQEWLNVTETETIPERPAWIK